MKRLLHFHKSNRKWHLPLIAGVCVGFPLLANTFWGNIEQGKIACLAGFAILYIQSENLVNRMILLMACCFGIMMSYSLGLFFSFNHTIASIVLGLYAFAVHFALFKLKLNRPPGNFFFIMLATISLCAPYKPEAINEKIGVIAVSSMFTCLVGFFYSLLTIHQNSNNHASVRIKNDSQHANMIQAATFGFFLAISLAIAFWFGLKNPYWIPISCLAVMHGANQKHVLLRSIQRMLGTLVGVALSYLFARLHPSDLSIAISIVLLQIIVEYFIVRNYAIAVVFVTMLTIFLAEVGNDLSSHTDELFSTRIIEIFIGSCIGLIGGWLMHNEKIHFQYKLQMRRVKILGPKNRTPEC